MSKERPVLTGTVCEELEMLRLAIEVLTGKRTSFVCFDFNTHRGRARIGEEEVPISCMRMNIDVMIFRVKRQSGGWYVCTFTPDGKKVSLADEDHPKVRHTVAGDFTMRWVGTSYVERHEEPLFQSEAEYCAKVRNMTLEELLNSKP